MTTYLALFRGLNIGGHNKLPMKELVSLLEAEGCRNLKTYIQSGNVIFTTNRRNRRKLSDDISQAISTHYGFSPQVILLTAAELRNAIASNPFPTHNGKALSFLFMTSPPERPDLDRLDKLKSRTEAFMLGDRVFYLYTPDGAGQSKLAANAERCLGVATTGRNWNTISRLAIMLDTTEQ